MILELFNTRVNDEKIIILCKLSLLLILTPVCINLIPMFKFYAKALHFKVNMNLNLQPILQQRFEQVCQVEGAWLERGSLAIGRAAAGPSIRQQRKKFVSA